MDYFKLDHDGTLVRTGPDKQQKYMGKERGWCFTQILGMYPHKPITEAAALAKVNRIENPPKKKKKGE